jgi:type III pantothenate kinase
MSVCASHSFDCLIDSGNSRVKFARREGWAWQAISVVDFDDPLFIEHCLEIIDNGAFKHVFSASVSKGWRAERFNLLLSNIRLPVSQIETVSQMGRLQIAYAQPKQLGVDRFLALLAASEQDVSCAILSLGSAITLDVLGADGRHRGGLIAPSPEYQWLNMRDQFPGLFESQGHAHLLANNTEDALASGIQHQILGMLDRVMYGAFGTSDVTLWVTGGAAEHWLTLLPEYAEHTPEILFNGMLRYIELSGL